MWIYSITAATADATTAVSRSGQTSVSNAISFTATAAANTWSQASTNQNTSGTTHHAQPLATWATQQGGVSSRLEAGYTQTWPGSTATAVETRGTTRTSSRLLSTGFSREEIFFEEGYTEIQSQHNAGSTYTYSTVTTSSSSFASTWLATRDSYRSGTQTTLAATTGATTTTLSTTTSYATAATGGGTASATATASVMTTTAVASTITVTSYATAAARTLTAAESLVPVTVAGEGEDLWEITATADTAGFISELGSQITSRVGTLATEATVLPTANTTSYGVTASSLASAAPATVDSTALTTQRDTYVPFAGTYPATATSTRAFDVLTVQEATVAQSQLVSAAHTVNGVASDAGTTAATIRRTTTAGLPVGWNQSPTVTNTALLGVTVATSSVVPDYARPAGYVMSLSSTGSDFSPGGITSISQTTTSTATASTTATATTLLYTYATTFTVFISSASATDGCALAPSIETASAQTNFAGYTNVEHFTTVHNAPSPHTLSTLAEQWQAYTLGSTSTTTQTTSTSQSTTSTIAQTGHYDQGFSYTSTQGEGVTLTWARLHPQVSFDGMSPWTAVAWRQGSGYQNPFALGTGDALQTSQPAAGSFAWIDAGTQLNASGAIAPALYTEARFYSAGATAFTARWDTTASVLHLTTASTFTTTALLGSATVTRASKGTTSTATASLATQAPATYYSITRITDGSKLGGQAGNTAFGYTALFGPGVRHFTTQAAGSSGSATSWATDWNVEIGTTAGLALPATAESAWSVTQAGTRWQMLHNTVFLNSTGATTRPLVVLSQYPNL